jgi:hypothetical protein
MYVSTQNRPYSLEQLSNICSIDFVCLSSFIHSFSYPRHSLSRTKGEKQQQCFSTYLIFPVSNKLMKEISKKKTQENQSSKILLKMRMEPI